MTADRNNGILTKNIIHEITKTGAPRGAPVFIDLIGLSPYRIKTDNG